MTVLSEVHALRTLDSETEWYYRKLFAYFIETDEEFELIFL